YATQQEADNYRLALESRQADIRIAQANIDARNADIQRLQELTKYERVEAPFDGVITSRSVDIGDLSNADSANLIASGKCLFKEVYDDTLRVRFDVPQSVAIGIADGLTAKVTVPEMPGRVFTGKIARNADALASGTRTLWAEVDIDNRDHVLKSGLYVNVHIDVPRVAAVVSVPSEALIFGDRGMQVAIVIDGKVKLRRVRIDQDDGATVDVVEGLDGGEAVVLSPYADIADGQAVTTAAAAAAPSLAQAD
ncbi:MAG TPA: efflux RND transporter periplasmic adaptor subunit, partial [Patescibacteria group bacterium]|nr:efflux RND transporter periplasmic adaptor subunit [Patescibacteria group bacterium]